MEAGVEALWWTKNSISHLQHTSYLSWRDKDMGGSKCGNRSGSIVMKLALILPFVEYQLLVLKGRDKCRDK